MMRIDRIKYLIILMLLSGCIKPFEPEFNNESVNKLVVQGMVSSNSGWQYVTVSRTSAVTDPSFIPVNNCQVKIIDDLGQSFELKQYEDGKYRVWMIGTFLVPGRSYKVEVVTPEDQLLVSTFDKMPNGSQVGDVYYEITELPTNDPDFFINGIQFYTDFIAGEQDSRYFRWKLTETWEYHTKHPIEFYYDGEVHHVLPPDSSQMYCWRTDQIEEIITLSTKTFSTNEAERFPLNYVQNNTNRLEILYSLLIEQSALSENAYNYWDELRLNSEQDGGLYNSQPIAVKGNIVNTSNPESEVLGYFQASTVGIKRVFVEPVEGLELDFHERCTPVQLRFGLRELGPRLYPAYLLAIDGNVTMVYLPDDCVLCTVLGGTTDKPNYWPQ
jgi:hypothetical protein